MIHDSQSVGFAFPTQNNDPESMKALMRVMQQHFVSKISFERFVTMDGNEKKKKNKWVDRTLE